MIARRWHGRVPAAKAAEYMRLMEEVGLADYRSTTIRETWQGLQYRRLRQAHLTNDFAGHDFCGQCPDWEATRWPGEGRSYADLVGELAAASGQ